MHIQLINQVWWGIPGHIASSKKGKEMKTCEWDVEQVKDLQNLNGELGLLAGEKGREAGGS